MVSSILRLDETWMISVRGTLQCDRNLVLLNIHIHTDLSTKTPFFFFLFFCWQYFDFSSCETNNSSYVSCLVKCQQMWKSGCPNIWNSEGSDQTVSRCHCIETYSYHKACTVLLLPKRPTISKIWSKHKFIYTYLCFLTKNTRNNSTGSN